MLKKIGTMLATLLGGVLLVYSASRSLHFIEITLPADSKMLAYFGLAALDGGLLAWTLAYLHGSQGGWQRAISILMVIVDMAGVIAFFTFDTLYQTGVNGMTKTMTAEQITNAVLGLSAIIGLNIVATIAHHVTHPDKLREMAEEEAFDKVESATLKQIATNADTLAAQLAPTLAADWQRQTQARYMAFVGTGKIPTLDLTAQDVTPSGVPMPLVIPQAQPKQNGLNLGAVLMGWLMNKVNGNGRTYESAMPSVPTVQPQAVTPSVNVPPIVDTQPQAEATAQTQAQPAPMNPLEHVPTYHPIAYGIKTTKPETVRDVIAAGLCNCPKEVFDVDAYPLPESLDIAVGEKVKGQGLACWDFATKYHHTNKPASVCIACPFFTNAPKS